MVQKGSVRVLPEEVVNSESANSTFNLRCFFMEKCLKVFSSDNTLKTEHGLLCSWVIGTMEEFSTDRTMLRSFEVEKTASKSITSVTLVRGHRRTSSGGRRTSQGTS